MTPFGLRLRELRAKRGVTLSAMAAELGISAAYLSALERGHRGKPTPGLIQQICGYFGLIWDDVETLKRLADLSHPRVTLDTSGLTPSATALANELARDLRSLPEPTIQELRKVLAERRGRERKR